MDWQKLNLPAKILVGITIIILAIVSPELAIILDYSGLEMTFSFLLVYYKSFFDWVKRKYLSFLSILKILSQHVIKCSIVKPHVFTSYVTASMAILFVTGSLFISMQPITMALIGAHIIQ